MDKGPTRECAWLREADKRLFPLTNIPSIIRLFKQQLESSDEPDLALVSIVAGAVENTLTCNRTVPKCEGDDAEDSDSMRQILLTAVEFKTVQALYIKFHSIIKGSVDLTQFDTKFATRELVKKVSDVIWNSLTRTYYKDRAHLQSLYSYLTGNKLDCFGVAFAVVAACQVLGFKDVHLALSEDHAWVVFGQDGEESAEVTWHGKGNEDKRGQPIGPGMSWLYVNGCPVICTRAMEVAAVVAAIHPSLNATTDCSEVAVLQQELSWLLYDLGHLARYPMGLGNLADLEDISPTPGRPPCSTLFQEATHSARTYYNNQHVYPYTYQGGYFYKHKMYKEAFECWANAADVIRMYNYTRDDEEIYKEFLEIANDLIPHIIKAVSSGHSAHSILKDPECFAFLLRFYDGICQWEEGSATPVLHIGWAKPLVNTISKFDADVRAKVIIEEVEMETKEKLLTVWWENSNTSLNPYKKEYLNNNNCYKNRENGPTILHSLESKLRKEEKPHPSIAALTMACGEKILNHTSAGKCTVTSKVTSADPSTVTCMDISTVSCMDISTVTCADPSTVTCMDISTVSCMDISTVPCADPSTVSCMDISTVPCADPSTVSCMDISTVPCANPSTVTCMDISSVTCMDISTVTCTDPSSTGSVPKIVSEYNCLICSETVMLVLGFDKYKERNRKKRKCCSK